MITNIISDLPGDESAPLFLLTGLRALLKMHMHPFSMTQKSSTAHSNPARKEAKENLINLRLTFEHQSGIYNSAFSLPRHEHSKTKSTKQKVV